MDAEIPRMIGRMIFSRVQTAATAIVPAPIIRTSLANTVLMTSAVDASGPNFPIV